MKRKEALKWIKKEAAKLKPETYAAAEKFSKPVLLKDGDGTPTGYQTAEVVDCQVNHYRRLKKAYDEQGLNAVHVYFALRGFVPQNQLKS